MQLEMVVLFLPHGIVKVSGLISVKSRVGSPSRRKVGSVTLVAWVFPNGAEMESAFW